jgi:hypothetical protein
MSEWITSKEDEQIMKEFRYLNSIDRETGNWRDLEPMFFSPSVLEKYGDNIRCKVGKNYISFLAPRGDEDLTVNFEIIDGRLIVQSKYFCFVPPRERKHWEEYRLSLDEESSDDYKLK